MKRGNVLLRLTVCLALGGMLTALWICRLIGFGIHTTVGKEALYLWLPLQALQLVTALRLWHNDAATGKGLRLMLRVSVCIWCGGAAALLFSLGTALTGASYGSVWVSLPCTLGTVGISLGWGGQLLCLWRRTAHFKQKEQKT